MAKSILIFILEILYLFARFSCDFRYPFVVLIETNNSVVSLFAISKPRLYFVPACNSAESYLLEISMIFKDVNEVRVQVNRICLDFKPDLRGSS